MKVYQPTPEAIHRAAEALRLGEAVVMPTETVYGLACDAMNEAAVRHVYAIKRRPETNPLILHLPDVAWAKRVAQRWSEAAQELAERFWPGPLTLVLPKQPEVPLAVTGGLDTVAIRVPSHPVALALLQAFDGAVAAPSANFFGHLSPTCAEDVDPAIAELSAMVLDGGSSAYGVESTVLDLSDGSPRILRPGAVSRAEIQAALGRPLGSAPPGEKHRAPGHHPRHYAPKCGLVLVRKLDQSMRGLVFGKPCHPEQVQMPPGPDAYAQCLYAALSRLDRSGTTPIYVEMPPSGHDWEAVHDRLERASQPESAR